MRRRLAYFALLLGAFLSMTAAIRVQVVAQEGGRVALVVRFDDERVESRCVALAEEEISGYDLLQRSGLALDVKSQGQGSLVCAIDGVGCAPGDCLCQCKGDPCVYWSYWRQSDAGWDYSSVGSTVRRLSHGDVDGWSWGPGSVISAIEPPALTFDDVCSPEAQVFDGSAAADEISEPRQWVPYAGLGLLLAAIGAGAFLASRSRNAA